MKEYSGRASEERSGAERRWNRFEAIRIIARENMVATEALVERIRMECVGAEAAMAIRGVACGADALPIAD